MIRVLHVLDELRLSGVERRILTAVDSWTSAGISTAVVATGAEVGPAVQRFDDAGVAVHHVPYRPRPGYVRDLAALARTHADVVQFHTERAFIHSELACRAVGCAVIHSPCTVIQIGGLWRARRIVQRWLARRAGVEMVTIGDSVHENERVHFKNPSRIIRNYINTQRFAVGDRGAARLAIGIEGERLVICSVGNCLGYKNHSEMFEAVGLWGGTRDDWTFLHAGHEIETGERELVESLGIADRCRFLGPVDDPATVLRAADVFVMPSLSEGLGNAALEAASCGLTLVLTNVAGLRDLKGHVELAIWTDTDAESIAAGLEGAADQARKVEPQQRARQHDAVKRTFGVERGAAEYAELYREIGSSRRGR